MDGDLESGQSRGRPEFGSGHSLGTGFQPIFSVRDCALAAHEALVRPVDGAGRPVRPVDFLAMCKGKELVRLDRQLRRTHLARFATLDEGTGLLCLNVHPVAALGDEKAAQDLQTALDERAFPASRLCVEILEDDCADEAGLARAIASYRRLGVRVAMEDFGTSRSDIERVERIRPDFVKLDRSLLAGAMSGAQPISVLAATIRRLKDAGAAVVVEGIEEAIEAYYAIEAGADYLQGYFLGAPRSGLAADPVVGRLVCEMKRRIFSLPD